MSYLSDLLSGNKNEERDQTKNKNGSQEEESNSSYLSRLLNGKAPKAGGRKKYDFNQGMGEYNDVMDSFGRWYDQSRSGMSDVGWGDAAEASAATNEEAASWMNRAGELRRWANDNKDTLGDQYQTVMDSLQQITNAAYWMDKGYKGKVDEFSQWDTQEEYDQYVADREHQTELATYNVPGAMSDMYTAWKDLEDARSAYNDLYELEGPYGLLANDAVPEDERQRNQARYDEIVSRYGEGITAEALYEQVRQMEDAYSQMQSQVDEATQYQGGGQAGSSSPLDESKPKNAADYRAELDELNSSIEAMSNYIDVLNARYAELENLDWNALQHGSEEEKRSYTTLRAEWTTLQQQLTQAEQDYDSMMSRKWQLEQDSRFKTIRENADYDQYTGYVVNQQDESGNVTSRPVDDQLYRYINSRGGTAFPFVREDHKQEDLDWIEKNAAKYSKFANMTDDEIADLNYIYRTQGQKAASDYITYLSPILDAREMQSLAGDFSEMASQGLGGAIVANALSVPLMMSGGLGTLDILAQNAARKLTGSYQPINYNSTNLIPTVAAQAVRKTTAANITDRFGTIQLDENEHPILAPLLNGRGLADVYQLGMSAIDSRVAGLTGNAAVATTLLASSAATQGVLDALERGATDEQALTLGLWNGAFEALFEFVEIDNLLKGNPNWVKNVVNQALIEGVGEGATSIANNIADAIIMADKSAINQKIAEYIEAGMDPETARKKALTEAAIDVMWDTIGGAVSGGISAGGMSMVNAVSQKSQYNRLPGEVKSSVDRLQNHGNDRDTALRISALLYEHGEEYGDSIGAYMAAYDPKQDAYAYAADFRKAYEIGRNNGNKEYLGKLSLNEAQQKIAYELGAAESRKASQEAKAPEVKEEERTYSVSDDGATIDSSGKNVTVKGFSSVGSKVTLELEGGKTIDAKEVSFGTADDAILYETIGQVTGAASTANHILESYETAAKEGMSASDFAAGLRQAYDLGVSGQVAERQLGTYELAGKLPVAARSAAFSRGRAVGQYDATARQAALEARGRQIQGKREGTFHFDRRGRTFDGRRESSLKAMEALSKALGVDIYVYESYKEGGKRVYQDRSGKTQKAPNGYYDAQGIHIDLNAGNFGQGTMMFTVAHELTHFAKEWSPVKFRKLADLLVERYAEQGTSVRDLIDRQIVKAKENGRTIDRDTAFEEVVADSMETMLTQGDIGRFMAELKQQDRSLWEKVRDWFKDLIQKLQAVVEQYKGAKPETAEGQLVAQMEDFIQVLQQAYAEALAEAGENYRANEGIRQELEPGTEGVVTKADGTPVAYATADNTVMLSMRTYDDSGRDALRKYLAKCVKNKSLTQQEMTDMLSDIEDIYMTCKEFKDKFAPFAKWSDAEVIRDTYGKPVFSVVTPNGEYKMNLDFSLVCKKRRTLDAVFNEMSRRGIIDDFELGQKSVVKINEIIRSYGLETACALCFVDAKRFRQASMADAFVDLYNELVYSLVPENKRDSISRFNFAQYSTIKPAVNAIDTWDNKQLDFSHLDHVMKTYGDKTVEHKAAKYIKTHPEGRKLLLRGDFMSSQGFDAVKTQNKDILSLYNSKKGTGGPKAAFGDVQYMNEIIKNSRGWSVKKAYEVGGVRIQSFSDYVPRMVFDYVQMIYDLSAKKLPAHAYSKEAIFVKQFGLTGVKINMSLIPAVAKDGVAPGLDKDGNYVWAGESFDFETAKQIQNAEGYTENCGTICVGVSYDHIVKLLNDPDIRMVIPYHKSGLNPIVAHMNKIAAFTDYTSLKTNPGGCQSTTDKNGSKVEKEFDFNDALQKVKDPQKAVEAYKAWCVKNQYKPKFEEFAWHPNYYKLLIDFTVYDKDGNYVPQRGVSAAFPKDGDAFGSMKKLIESGLQEDAVAEGKRDKNLGAIVDEIQRTLPKTEAEIEETEVEQADRDLEAEDVKLSDRDAGAEKVVQALEEQNAKLKEDVKDLRELLRMQGKLTHGQEFKKSSIDAAVKGLAKEAMATLDAEDRKQLHEMLKDFYRYIAADKELAWEGVAEKAGQIADFLMDRVNIKPQRDGYSEAVLRYLRGNKIRLSDSQRAEVEKLYGYQEYRKMLFGAGVYLSKDGMELDSLWHDASGQDNFPGTFREDVNEGDQPAELLRIIEAMREGDDSNAMEYAYNHEAIRQGLIWAVYDSYWRVDNLTTVADKKQKQIDAIRKEHRKRMDALKEDQKYTLEKLRTIRENVLHTVRTEYEEGAYLPVKMIEDMWKTDRKRALGEFRQIESTFIQMAKDFEKFGQQRVKERAKDRKGFEKEQERSREQFKRDLEKEAAKHDKDNALWTREFERLLKEYDKSGQKIERLEERYKTREENLAAGKQRKTVEKAAKDLMDMLSKPTKEAHVPMALQAPLEKFLNSIDFSSKRALAGGELTIKDVAYTRALQEVRTAIAQQRTALEGAADGTFSLDVPKDFLDRIEQHINLINKATEGLDLTTGRVYEMTSDELKDLAFILKTINKAIRDIDQLHMAGAKARVSELAKSTVWEMGRRKAVKTEDGGAAMWANYTPTFAFERMGTAATQVLNGLKMGQAKLARTAASVIKFSQETYTNKEVNEWENEIHEVELDSGKTVKMTTAQVMSFYCLSRREQAKGHLNGGGIRMGNIGEGRKMIRQTEHFRLTQEDIARINGLLTDRQREVANKLQRYMADVGGRLGNEISMARWDYMEMTDRDYFPIRSDSDIHDAKNPDQDKTNLWALLNKSFTKQVTPGANDAMIVSSIFDVFADHMSDMAEYNAFALPLVDAMKWYNYRETEKQENGQIKTIGVKKAINDKLGTAAGKYFIDLMTDINSSQKAGRYENFFGKLLSRSKAASVGWNLRVAIQQPTAILRASVYLDPRSLVKGTARLGMKRSAEEMKKYSGIALWKSLGYYDLNISRGIRDQIKGDTTLLDKINDAGMWLPGFVDERTWARIWESCKEQVRRQQKLSDERLLEETAKLFEDVVYHTQVADSVLTRSSLMRSKSQTVKELTSFMAEPTLSVNLLMNAFQDYQEGVSRGEKAKRTMKILFCGYVLSAIANAVFTAFADAARDDDEYEGYWDKFFQALLGEKFYDGNLFAELNPLEKIVFVRDVLSLLQGYEGAKNPFVELAESGIKLVQNIVKFFQGKGSLTAYGLIYQSLQVLGGFTGAAPANLLREATTIWNLTFGKWNNMMIHRYKTSPKESIRNAYDSGAMTKSEARDALVAAGESVTDAYWILKRWDAGENIGMYDDVYKAALAWEDIGAAVDELVEHGEKTEKEVLSQLKSQIGTWYTDPESKTKIDRAEAKRMLETYFDMDADEIEEQLRLWDMKVDTGFSLNDLKEKFLNESVSAEEAVRFLMEYGGKDQEEAQERVDDWAFELEHGYSYDDIRQTYLDEEITAEEARSVMMEVAGKTKEEADRSIKLWDHEKETGWRYEDRATLYKDGKITREQLVDALIDVGDYDRKDAGYQVEVYEWEMDGLEGATINRVEKWHEYCEKAGVSKEQFLKIQKFSADTKNDVDADGDTIKFSAMKKVMAEIDKLPLKASQKDALARSLGWSDKNISKYKPW